MKVANKEMRRFKLILDNEFEDEEVEVVFAVLIQRKDFVIVGLLLKKPASGKFHRIGLFHGRKYISLNDKYFQEVDLVVEWLSKS